MSRVTASGDLRTAFVEFFRERGHDLVPSAPLVPRDDPTLLFTSAGMVPFKPYYLAEEPPLKRAVSIQRCLRLSDLEEVGHTPYHDTFFEMLGNFSFGDYFKREAIGWAWEFLMDVIGLPRERLWATVYRDDEAAAEIWREDIGLPPARVVALGDDDNFWGPAGAQGPCGPCSEIYYDMGEEVGCGRPDCRPGCDCDRYFEFWNLVFPQYLQHPDATREPLGRSGIDTGMGLERLATVVQGARSIFETDLFAPIVAAVRDEVESATGEAPSGPVDTATAIIADHARASAFAIAENILPSNEAQGYVVRRLIRRAVRRGLSLGVSEPFLYRVAGAVVDVMGGAHPHLVQKREHVALVLKAEEERFRETLSAGTASLEETISALSGSGSTVIPGDLAFRLYDTFGFPVDLTAEMAAERGLTVDLEGFEAQMEKQRERGRSASAFDGSAATRPWRGEAARAPVASAFVGGDAAPEPVDRFEAKGPEPGPTYAATVVRVRNGAVEGEVEAVLTRTPFYAEAGGQTADRGDVLTRDGATLPVVNVYREDGEAVHVIRGERRALAPGSEIELVVDMARRRRIEKNHTATHLLQAALRELLGEHVHQSGSWVGPDRLRFDFTHFSELSADELTAVEDRVNEWVRSDLEVRPETMKLERALTRGAMALFGEKYGEDVRVVCILAENDRGVSLELCGGTHVRRTGEIGAFAIVSESSVAAGVRRIEAVTGRAAIARARDGARLLSDLAQEVRSTSAELRERIPALVEENARLRKELASARREAAGSGIEAMLGRAVEVAGLTVASGRSEATDIPALREEADRLRAGLGSGVGVLGAVIDGSGVVVAVVTDDLVKARVIRAGDIVREVASAMGGRGGGKPHLAQGGGEPGRLDEALGAAPAVVARLVSKEGAA